MSLVVWLTDGCYCKVVAVDRKHSCISGNMVDMWMLLLGGCCRHISIFVPLVVWLIGECYCKMVL